MNNETAFTFRYGKYKNQPITSADMGYLRWLALNSRPKSFPTIHIVATDELVRRYDIGGKLNPIDKIDAEIIEIIAENASDADVRLLVYPRYLKIQAEREAKRQADDGAYKAYKAADASLGDPGAVVRSYKPTKSVYDSYATYEGFYADVKRVVERAIMGSRNDDPHSSRRQDMAIGHEATGEGRIMVTVWSNDYVGH